VSLGYSDGRWVAGGWQVGGRWQFGVYADFIILKVVSKLSLK